MSSMRNKAPVKKYEDSGLIDLQKAHTERYRRAESFEAWVLKPDEKDEYIESVANEIHLRLRSIKKQVLEIGGLLLSVKSLLGQSGNQKFTEWIKENFPFSHRTANNYMRVYMVCGGEPELVDMFKPSTLYKIASLKFPQALREELFESAQKGYTIEQKDLAVLHRKYVNKEIDLNSNEFKKLIRKQKDVQANQRYVKELRNIKRDITRGYETIKKLNSMGIMDPTAKGEKCYVGERYSDLETILTGFMREIEERITNLDKD